MKKFFTLPVLLFLVTTVLFFQPFFLQAKLPIPADTIIGLYHPYRDLYAKDYPNGIPYKNFLITDPIRQQYPWKFFVIENIKHGQLPLWNPYNFSGTPLLANFQSGVFYPLNIFLFITPFYLGWSFFIFAQPLLAMVFMYFYLRNLRLGIGPSMLGAVSFAFCGFSVSWMEWGNVVSTGLWLPLILLSIDKLFTSSKFKVQSAKFLLFLGAIVAAFFAGHLQVFFYLYVVSLVYFIVRLFHAKMKKRHLFIFLLLNFCFLIFTFFQWFPTLQFIMESARNLDQNWQIPGWFIPWQNLTQFIAPDFFGNPTTLNYWGIWNYGEFVGYIGILPLLLALYAMLFFKRKIVWFFSLLFLISLIFALPTPFAKIPFELEIPFLSTSQPTRLIYLADFALCVLTAFGLEFLLKNKKRIIVPVAIVGLLIITFWGYIFLNQQLPISLHITTENLVVTKNNLKLPTLLFAASAFLLLGFMFFDKKIKHGKTIFIVVLLLITVVDLYRFSTKYLTFADNAYLYPDTKVLAYLKDQPGTFRVMSTDSRIFPPNFSIMHRIQTPDGYDPLFLQRYAEFSAAILRGQPNISPPFGFNRIITIQTDTEFINLLNIKFVLSLGEIQRGHLQKIMTEGQTVLYENTNVLPRAFFVEEIEVAHGKQDAINKLFANQNSLNSIAIVEGIDQEKAKSVQTIPADVTILSYQADGIVLVTDNIDTKFLVLTDSFYPTWHAKICSEDGSNCEETEIFLTDYTFRGIIVPGGKHRIEFYNSLL